METIHRLFVLMLAIQIIRHVMNDRVEHPVQEDFQHILIINRHRTGKNIASLGCWFRASSRRSQLHTATVNGSSATISSWQRYPVKTPFHQIVAHHIPLRPTENGDHFPRCNAGEILPDCTMISRSTTCPGDRDTHLRGSSAFQRAVPGISSQLKASSCCQIL